MIIISLSELCRRLILLIHSAQIAIVPVLQRTKTLVDRNDPKPCEVVLGTDDNTGVGDCN